MKMDEKTKNSMELAVKSLFIMSHPLDSLEPAIVVSNYKDSDEHVVMIAIIRKEKCIDGDGDLADKCTVMPIAIMIDDKMLANIAKPADLMSAIVNMHTLGLNESGNIIIRDSQTIKGGDAGDDKNKPDITDISEFEISKN